MNLGPQQSDGGDGLNTRSPAAGPRVSVIIPTRDRPSMLRDAIASIRAQTFTDYELIVVVNGPDTPLTAQSVEVAAGCNVMRIKTAGIAGSVNAAMRAARGEWLAFLDDDDLWEPNRLEVGLKTADTSKADVVFCNYFRFDENGGTPDTAPGPQPPLSAKEAMTIKICAAGFSAAMIKRSAMLAVGGCDEALLSNDWDLWIRLSWRFSLVWADARLVWIRTHAHNESKQISWAYWTWRTQYKALRTLPPELRHLRPRILFEMLKVVVRSSEFQLRHKVLRHFKRRKPARRGPLEPPIPAEATTRLHRGEKSPTSPV
jgi:glycosyltransferase involved in cell wall biosynthesis